MRNSKLPNLPRPSGLLIDLDNTFYSYRRPHERALEKVRAKVCVAVAVDEGDFDKAYDQARFEIKQQLSGTASCHSRLLYFSRMLELLGLKTQPMLALNWEQVYWREFLRTIELRPGVREFLQECRQLEMPIAVVTDLTAQVQYRKLVFLGVDNLVEYVVTSEETGHDKPHASMFELACEKLGVDGNSVWMVGDEPVSDIRGAKQALGCTAIQIVLEPGSVECSSEADAVVKSFDDLRKLLSRSVRLS